MLTETSKNEMLNIEKTFIRSADTLPKKVIFVTYNLVDFCTDPRKFCIIGIDPTQ